VVEGLLGLRYSSPAQHMREYLELLEPLLCGEEVHHFGRYYRVDGGFTVPGTSPVSVVVGALGAQMVDVAGRCSDGVITWLAGPRSLSQDIVPIASAAAADVGRPAPRVIAGVPVMVCEDRDAGRALAERTFARYAGLENYRRLFEREGIGSVADLALVGAEAEVLEGLDALAAAGVTDLWPVVLAADVDSADRATELLAGLQLRAGLTAIQAGVR
jgi:alkanesulfonate monooxygenase SsuD/methylene tetrahydromethanopterin reductase-like flavin-dependent oxidoreductase (luciferase family)